MDIPSPIRSYLLESLQFPQRKICAQVATQSQEEPHIRTMKLVDIDSKGELIFLTNLMTQKWQDLVLNPKAAILIFDQNADVQILSRGNVILDTIVEHREKVKHYWQKVRFSVKKVFYENPKEVNHTEAPNTFGVITFLPVYWEILKVNQEDYALSLKFGYQKSESGWDESKYRVRS